MVNTDLEIDLDEMLRVVTPRHRRWALYLLMEREIHTSSELASGIRFLTEMASGDSVEEGRIAIQFQQIHLPKLADAGFIEYDHRNGTITLIGKTDEIRSELKIIKQWEESAVQAEI